MKLYAIFPPRNINENFSFNVKGNNEEDIFNFFLLDDGSKFLKKPRINLTYDDEFKTKINEIMNCDFYFSSSGLLLFSHNFYILMNDYLKDDCIFFPCLFNNEPIDIYALYVKKKMHINDVRSSIINNNLYIFKDINEPYVYRVTENFKILSEHNNLKMILLELN